MFPTSLTGHGAKHDNAASQGIHRQLDISVSGHMDMAEHLIPQHGRSSWALGFSLHGDNHQGHVAALRETNLPTHAHTNDDLPRGLLCPCSSARHIRVVSRTSALLIGTRHDGSNLPELAATANVCSVAIADRSRQQMMVAPGRISVRALACIASHWTCTSPWIEP